MNPFVISEFLVRIALFDLVFLFVFLPFSGAASFGIHVLMFFWCFAFRSTVLFWEGVCQSGLKLDLDLSVLGPSSRPIPPKSKEHTGSHPTNKQTGPSTSTRAVVRPHCSKPSPSCPDNPCPQESGEQARWLVGVSLARPHRLTGKHTTLP